VLQSVKGTEEVGTSPGEGGKLYRSLNSMNGIGIPPVHLEGASTIYQSHTADNFKEDEILCSTNGTHGIKLSLGAADTSLSTNPVPAHLSHSFRSAERVCKAFVGHPVVPGLTARHKRLSVSPVSAAPPKRKFLCRVNVYPRRASKMKDTPSKKPWDDSKATTPSKLRKKMPSTFSTVVLDTDLTVSTSQEIISPLLRRTYNRVMEREALRENSRDC
jgi:hypothetical protein